MKLHTSYIIFNKNNNNYKYIKNSIVSKYDNYTSIVVKIHFKKCILTKI